MKKKLLILLLTTTLLLTACGKAKEMSAKDIRAEGYKGTVKPLYNRLFSADPKFVQLRKELFATGYNLNRLKKYKLA